MSYTTIIDEEHLATFQSPAEANIHRIANIAKLKLGLLTHYLDYRDWVLSQREENSRVQRETGMIPIVNFREVFHSTFNSWLKSTRLENEKVITENRKKIVSYHPDLGYIDEDIAQAMAIPDINPVPMPDSLKEILAKNTFEKSIEN